MYTRARALAALALVALLASAASPAAAQKTDPAKLPADSITNDCLTIQSSWNFCGAWAGAAIDLKATSAYATLWRRPAGDTKSLTLTFDSRMRNWLRGDVKEMPGDLNQTLPAFFGTRFGCTGYKNTHRRYLISMTCMSIVDLSKARCKTTPKALCAKTCNDFVSGTEKTFADSAMCPGANGNRAGEITGLKAQCSNANGPFGGSANCIDGDTNEPNTCGYMDTAQVCNAALCPASKAFATCKSSTDSSSSASPATGADSAAGSAVGGTGSSTAGSGASSDPANAASGAVGAGASTDKVAESSGMGMGMILGIVGGVVVVAAAIGAFVITRRRGAAAKSGNGTGARRMSDDDWPPQKPVVSNLDSVPRNATAPAPSMSPKGNAPNPYEMQAMNSPNPQQQQMQQPPMSPYGQQQPQQQQMQSPLPNQPQPANLYGNMSPNQQMQQQQPMSPAGQSAVSEPAYNNGNNNPAGMQSPTGSAPPAFNPYTGQQQMPLAAPVLPPLPDEPVEKKSPKASKRVSSMMISSSMSRGLGAAAAAANAAAGVQPQPQDNNAAVQGGNDDEFGFEFDGEQYKATRNYDPVMSDELELVVGDILSVTSKYDDGWGYAINMSTGQLGVFPLNFASPVEAREDPTAVPTRKSMYGDLDRLSMYRQSVKLDVKIDSEPFDMDFDDHHHNDEDSHSNATTAKSANGPAPSPAALAAEEVDPRQTAVPADPSSINALMAVLERISADDNQGDVLKDQNKRATIEMKVSRLPPEVRDSIVSAADGHGPNAGNRFSFSALMSVLDDPQLQHHQSVYLDKKQGNRDTLYSTYTFYDDLPPSGSVPAMPKSPTSGYAQASATTTSSSNVYQLSSSSSSSNNKGAARPLSTMSDLDRWEGQLGQDSAEMTQELNKLRGNGKGNGGSSSNQYQQHQYRY
ncbi:rho guanine nucleotide exchange factor [Blastocladiella emersonii ATCC 22665]|nr:rho guanine nucleotide exchange factor [Blastocladiella emersonii ATCC 22665]